GFGELLLVPGDPHLDHSPSPWRIPALRLLQRTDSHSNLSSFFFVSPPSRYSSDVDLCFFLFLFHPKLEFCICLLLTILGYIPGIIYAIYVLVAVDHQPYRRNYYEPLA
ncbi:unnamed protein product, partial [Musa textilis]